MSKKRKSFIIHFDSLNVLDDLTNEQAGLLFNAIRNYQLGIDSELDPLTKVAFSPFKNQFARDADKYENLCEKNRLIAVNRHLNKSTKSTSGNQSLPQVTKSTDNDSKSDSKSDSKDINTSSLKNDGFVHFYSAYPKKVAKPDAMKAFKAATKNISQERFMEFVDHVSDDCVKRYKETERQFIPSPAKYIRQELYNDDRD